MDDHIEAVEDELERLDHAILAAEDWSPEYSKDPATHAKLIKLEAKIARLLRKYFKEQADRSEGFIDWFVYNQKLKEVQASAFDVAVILKETLGTENDLALKVLFDPLSAGITLGAKAGEKIYTKNIGMTESSAAVQKAAKTMVAQLVGKKVAKDGTITDNPKTGYSINDKLLDDIRQSISKSIALGEDQQQAAKRMADVIDNPVRADMIARTEAVNSYSKGLMVFGEESGAVGKEWQDVGAIDECAEYANLGPVAIDYEYAPGLTEPTAHVNCRCGQRLIYSEEWKALGLDS